MATVTPPRPTAVPTIGGSAPATGTDAGTGAVPLNASDLLKQTLTSWGLSSLLTHLTDYISSGYDADTIQLALQDTQEWKTRFAGNVIRQQKGLPVLSPAQYIATEEQYSNILQSYGLPTGFYDSHDDFNNFIGNDVSPTEVQTRAQIAHDQYLAAPPEMKQAWQSYFGNSGDAIAAILDPKVATAVIQDRANQVAIGGTAAQNGFQVTQARASAMAQHGVTLAQAQKAYQQIAQSAPVDQNIASRFGQSFGQDQEENDLLLNDGAATAQRQQLYSSENALFKGGAGATAGGLGVSQEY